MARKVGQGEEDEESRARQQGERRQPAMKRRCRSYRFILPASDTKLKKQLVLNANSFGKVTVSQLLYEQVHMSIIHKNQQDVPSDHTQVEDK
ncbi:hypothetical protein STEG23_020691 [Scotinomys teguina]